MTADNPSDLAKIIIKDVSGEYQHVFQPAPPKVTYLDSHGASLPEDEFDEVLLQNSQTLKKADDSQNQNQRHRNAQSVELEDDEYNRSNVAYRSEQHDLLHGEETS